MENKQAFVVCLQAAFIAGDSKRYAHGVYKVNITGASCAAITDAFIQNFI